MKKTTFSLLILMVLTMVGITFTTAEDEKPGFSQWVDRKGNITLPTGFRATWTHLGSWAVKGEDDSLSFHDVYTEPESLAYFNERGEFPDGATLYAKQNDWVYVQGYPTLQLASSKNTAPANEMSSMGAMASDSDNPPGELVVTIDNLTFTPSVIKVKPGQTVTWVNRDNLAHTATADDKSFDTGFFAAGKRAQITFEKAGTFPYHCTPHPFMKASVIVEE